MIVGIAGLAESGKDAAADALVSHYGFVRESMAKALRQECTAVLKNKQLPEPAETPEDIQAIIALGQVIDVYAKPSTPQARRLLQWYGSEYRRGQDPDYWVEKIEPLLDHVMDLVIPDIRYANEVEMIRRHGGQVWLIKRPHSRKLTTNLHSHMSEKFCAEYTNWDLIIHNIGNLKELENKVLVALSSCYSGITDVYCSQPTNYSYILS